MKTSCDDVDDSRNAPPFRQHLKACLRENSRQWIGLRLVLCSQTTGTKRRIPPLLLPLCWNPVVVSVNQACTLFDTHVHETITVPKPYPISIFISPIQCSQPNRVGEWNYSIVGSFRFCRQFALLESGRSTAHHFPVHAYWAYRKPLSRESLY